MIKNYIKVFEDGSQIATKQKPVFGLNNVRTKAGYNPDVYTDGKWYNSINGTELVTNGTFDVDTTGWIASIGTGMEVSNGILKITDNGADQYVYQGISTEVGKKYTLKCFISGTGQTTLYITNDYTSTTDYIDYKINTVNTANQYNIEFIAQSTTTYIKFYIAGTNGLFSLIDNVTCFELNIEPDTAYTAQPTYLPYVVNLDESGNVLDYDKFDIPTLVEDYVKADIVEGEHKGKNSCTAWVSFNGTTTPPTIRDSYNVSQVIRVGTGMFDIYFEEPMDNTNGTVSGSCLTQLTNGYNRSVGGGISNTNKAFVSTWSDTAGLTNVNFTSIQIFGGKK